MSGADIRSFCASGSWRELARVAAELVAAAERRAGVEMKPLLGGGTRLMLTYELRISNDIDLFIHDARWLGFLTPRLHDDAGRFPLYEEASNFLKIKLPDGEIDFIVGMSLLGLGDESYPGLPFALEPVAEVLAKKLFYRGASLTARDLYDWWAVSSASPDVFPPAQVVSLLGSKVSGVETGLKNLSRSRSALGVWDALITRAKPKLTEVIAWAESQIMAGSKLECGPDEPTMS